MSLTSSKYFHPALAVISGIAMFISIGYWMLLTTGNNQKITVISASRNLNLPTILNKQDLKEILVSRDTCPKFAVIEINSLVGKTLLHPLTENEIFTINHITRKQTTDSESQLVPKKSLGFSLPTDWLAGTPPKISVGDKIMLIASQAGHPVERGTIIITQDTKILSAEKDKEAIPKRMFLDVTVGQAGMILQARANNMLITALALPYD